MKKLLLCAFICSFTCLSAIDFNTYSEPEKVTLILVGPFEKDEVSLESIELKHGTKITDQSLVEIGQRYPALKGLMVNGDKVTDDGLIALAEGCPDLRLLVLDPRFINWNSNLSDEMKEGQITDRGAEKLAVNCPRLESVTLAGHKISDIGVEFLAGHCPELYGLYLQSDNKNGILTDKSLAALAACTKLEALNVDGHHGITYEGVKVLIESGSPLRTVSISHTSVSQEEYEALSKMRPDIHFFWAI